MKKTIWDIKKGQKYYCIMRDGKIVRLMWQNESLDELYREYFNAFITLEEAKAELAERKKKAQALKPILDEAERRYLKAVIRPFRDRVNYITKERHSYGRYEFINVNLTSPYVPSRIEVIDLPYFETGTMYIGMERAKRYTPKELGL